MTDFKKNVKTKFKMLRDGKDLLRKYIKELKSVQKCQRHVIKVSWTSGSRQKYQENLEIMKNMSENMKKFKKHKNIWRKWFNIKRD